MSRGQLNSIIGIGNIVEPTITKAYENKLRKEWEGGKEASPHGYRWSTRLHASQAPGADSDCKRKLLYSLLGLPKEEPDSVRLIRYAEVGLDAEARLVDIWYEDGILLSAHTNDEFQTNLTDKEHWFSGNMDAAILRESTKSPHIIEIKSRGIEKVSAMKSGRELVDPAHEAQLRSYLSMAHEQKLFMDDPRVENPCISGTVLYIARDNPNIYHEFQYEWDEQWWLDVKDRLSEVVSAYKEERNDLDIPRLPDGKKVGWSKGACQWCSLKPECKKDFIEENFDLRNSNLVKKALEIDPTYDYDAQRERVFAAWE